MCDNNRVPYEEVAALYENQISFHYVPIALIPETKDGRLCIQGYTFDKVLNVIDADISEKIHGIKIYQNTQALLQDVLPHRKYRLDGTCPALRREILIKDNVEMILLCNEGQDRIDTWMEIPQGIHYISMNLWSGEYSCEESEGKYHVQLAMLQMQLLILDGNKIGRPTKHIRVFDCCSAYGHGITIGSEMSGGVEDVRIWDCDMSSSLFGIEIKGTWKRGGYVRNVHAIDCKVSRVLLHSVGYNNDGIAADIQPYFEDCSFENLSISGKYYDHYKEERGYCDAIELIGFDEPGHELKNIVFRNITIGIPGESRRQNISLQLCENIILDKITCL